LEVRAHTRWGYHLFLSRPRRRRSAPAATQAVNPLARACPPCRRSWPCPWREQNPGGIAMVIAYDAAPSNGETHCSRCDTRLIMGRYEPNCPCCGNAIYRNTRDMEPRWQRTSILSSATRDVIRYIGDSVHLLETLTHVRLIRRRNLAVYAVTCPFCQNAMERTSISGMRSEPTEQRFRCSMGHMVSLVPQRNGRLGWR
jgi:hypothetical protein